MIALDPEAAAKRAERARRDRRVAIEPEPQTGMGWLNAYLSAQDLCAIDNRLELLARKAKGADDERTHNELRADVLRDLILGKPGSGGIATKVYVTVTAESLLGLSNLPGELRGYGPLPAEQIRELAYTMQARWMGVLVDGDGHPQAMSSKHYRFQGRLAEYIRLRDGTCSHPACNRPADRCDIDHRIPYPRGETSAGNGDPDCRRHHRQKHEAGWRIRRDKDTGDIIWQSPDGKILRTPPEPLPAPEPPPNINNDPPPF